MKAFSAIKHLTLVFIILALQLYGCGSCFHKERTSLLEIKAFFNTLLSAENRREPILPSWTDDPHSNCCSWERVNCSAATGRVVELSLAGLLPYSYPFPQQNLNLSMLNSFEELQGLDLSANLLTGFVDHIEGFSNMTKLKTLDLSNNLFSDLFQLQGLAYLKELRVLNLGDNKLNSSSHPSQVFSNLTKLEVLDLSYNHLSFDVLTQEFSNMTKLKTLDLSDNEFSDLFQLQGLAYLKELRVLNLGYNSLYRSSQPSQVFANLTKLEVLDLSGTHLSFDVLTQGFSYMTKLKVLDLRSNQFSDLFQLQGLAYLKELKELYLRFNRLNSISQPSQVFANLTKLEVLDLSHNDLSFHLQTQGYSEICRLTYLQELDLSKNAFIGLPNCLGNLTRLRTLDLSHNQLSGNVPSFLPNLPSIEYLSLLRNNFSGSFLISSFTNQSRLKVFKLSSKLGMFQVQTERSWIPPFQLKTLQLQNCTLGGTIPSFLLHQHDLSAIDLADNKLVGTLPAWLLQNNTKLKYILLKNNFLTELRLPKLVHGLVSLDISDNKITGSLNEDIGFIFPKLEYMNISNNGFQGTIPSSMGEMKSLLMLDMSFNSLSGQLPGNFLNGCQSLRVLMLSNNKFQGQVFPEHADLAGLKILFLNSNNFTGNIGKGLLNSIMLNFLDISDNMFSGRVPSWIGRLSDLICLSMGENQIEGPFPYQLQNLIKLEVLDISNNRLFGSIPRNISFLSLQELSLQNNDLIGSIPNALFELTSLQVLDLRNNSLSGKISDSIGNIQKLNVLLLQKNHLHGHLPKEICQLREVNLLDLSYNWFSGVLPSCLGNMSFGTLGDGQSTTRLFQFRFFMAKYNSTEYYYTSSVDDIDKNFYDFEQLITVDFRTKSRQESFRSDMLPYMFGLDLSSNQLSGDILFQIGDLHNIHSLNLSHNCLTGFIPESISKLKNIESLDLSYNRLKGNIPTQVAELDSLGYFDVSYNNLSGPIPFTGHHITFGEKSYIGNTNLCGPPTNKSCGFTTVPKSAKPRDVRGEDEDPVIDMVWFYWSFGAAYATILLGLFVFLCIDSRWSREWFYRVDLCVYHLQRLKHTSIFK